jgi:hypothetical protein
LSGVFKDADEFVCSGDFLEVDVRVIGFLGEEFDDLVCGEYLVFEIEVVAFFFEERKAFFDDFGEVLGEDVFGFGRVNWAYEYGGSGFGLGVDVLLNEGGDELFVDAGGESHGCVVNRLVGKCIRMTKGRGLFTKNEEKPDSGEV